VEIREREYNTEGSKRAPSLEALSGDEAGAEPSTAWAAAASTASGAARCARAASATQAGKRKTTSCWCSR